MGLKSIFLVVKTTTPSLEKKVGKHPPTEHDNTFCCCFFHRHKIERSCTSQGAIHAVVLAPAKAYMQYKQHQSDSGK